MISQKKISYHHRIIITLLLLSMLFLIPYTIILYISSTSKIKETIVSSNEDHLNQIYLDFEEARSSFAQQVYSIYTGSNMQYLLYSSESGSDAISELQTIQSNIVSANPSIYSVAFYNAGQDKFYTTTLASKDDSLFFVSQQTSPKKMTPIFRKISYPYAKDDEMYLFSYLMYEYRMTQGNPSSFVIINQDVAYLLHTIQSGSYVESTNADVFLFSEEFGICGDIKNIAKEHTEHFVSEFIRHKSNSDVESDIFTISVDGEDYLISYASLEKTDVEVVIIQPKSIVFSSLTAWQLRFVILLAAGLAIYLVIVYFQAKALYRPVEVLSNHIRELEGSGFFNTESNEFEQFKAVYSSFTTLKQKYYLRYVEDQLLNNSSDSVISTFSEAFPNHWLLHKAQLLVVLIAVEFSNFTPPNRSENELDLYAVQNISEEIMGEAFCFETLSVDQNHLAMILGSDSGWSSLHSKLGKVQKSISHFFDFSICVYCSDPITSLDELSNAYQQTYTLESYTPMFGKSCVLFSDAIEENLSNQAISYPQSMLNELTSALSSRRADKIHASLQSLSSETKKLSIQNLWLCISLLINHIRNVLLEFIPASPQQMRFMKQLTSILNDFTSVDEFFTKLEKLIISVVCTGEPLDASRDKSAIFLHSVEEYIDAHYQDSQLSAQQIADQFDISANYLPRKFLQLSGMSLNSYILQVRMQHAATLLRNCDLAISEISYKVGIENESYFYKLFKKYYNCTPKEYREQHI